MTAVLRAAVAAVIAIACSGDPPAPRLRNAVVIVVDTLRRDHVGVYGYARDTSPAIDALAAEGVRFERAYAPTGWTAPSVATILTGLYPSAHGVVNPKTALPDGVRTLAEILRQAGYATAGVVSNKMIGQRAGFQQGFDVLDEQQARDGGFASTPGVAKTAVGLLERMSAGERPFFLLVHFFDPHYGYRTHPEFGFAAARAGRLDGSESISALRAMADDLTEAELAFVRDLYDEEIRFTDAGVGRVLGALARLGHADDTVVVLTADHGEEFLERGWLGHTVTLHDELVRVPLVVRAPGIAPRVVSQPVSLTAVTPTVLQLLGVESSDGFQAASLVGQLQGPSEEREEESDGPLLLEVDFKPATILNLEKTTTQQGLVADGFKLIRDARAQRVSLYDLSADPGERRNLAAEQPERVARMTAQLDARLDAVRQRQVTPRVRELSERETRELQALGYGD